jgi:hypothetical protein
MLRHALGVPLAVLALVGTGIAVAAPAQAECAFDHACMHSDAGFGGYEREDYNSRNSWANILYDGTSIPLYAGDYVPSNVSSIENRDPDSVISVFYNSGWAGPCFKIAANGAVSNMDGIALTNGKAANDNMNSHRFGNYCSGTTYNF